MRPRAALAGLVIVSLAIPAGCQDVSIKKVVRGISLIETRKIERLTFGEPSGEHTGRTPRERKRDLLVAELEAVARADQRIQEIEVLGGRAGALVEARANYREALGAFVRESSGRTIRLDDAWRDRLAEQGIRIAVRREREGAGWSPNQFDEFLIAHDFEVQGLKHEYHGDGVGVPLIGIRSFRVDEFMARHGQDKFLMPRQIYPVTLTLRRLPASFGGAVEGNDDEFLLELHDPLVRQDATVAGRTERVAADFSTPLAYQFGRSPLPILQEIGLLDPRWLEKLQGLYMLHPYEPGKIPVLLVHGLRSSPAAWMQVVNELRGDPTLRDRYQFWLFMYPTGVPFPASAAHLRRALDELREVVDPRREDVALDRMVLVGHSMGGLISKMMVLESGDELWKLVANRSFEELRATQEHRELIERVFFFRPHPSVRRIVFVATPHGGSELGDQFIGRLTHRLIRLPGSIRSTYRVLLAQNGPDFFTPQVRGGLPTSVRELSLNSPLLKTLARLPVGRDIAFHSIIARKQEIGPLESTSDGVVPYTSAHLAGVASELVVPGDHGCQDSMETIAEIRRILYLHLRQYATDGGRTVPDSERLPEPIAISPLSR